MQSISIFERELVLPAILDAFMKLDPRTLIRNPVMFTTAVVAALATVILLLGLLWGAEDLAFQAQLVFWLWLTVLFGNFAEALAEGRGKAQAKSLRNTKDSLVAFRIEKDNSTEQVAATQLRVGDIVLVTEGQQIPADGEVVTGVASVNEAAITGESAPVIREAGGDRSAVTAGTNVISDEIRVRVTAEPGSGFLDRMIALVEGASRQKTPNEIALTILLTGLTLIFLVAVGTLPAFARFAGGVISVPVLIALFVALIPTTISGLLSAIGIAGMDRLIRFNVLAKSGRAVEAAGDIGTLLLDKTGTITIGDRQATEFVPLPGIAQNDLINAARLSSLADTTPEGRSIVKLAGGEQELPVDAVPIGFTAQTRVSGVDLPGRTIRKGAVDAVLKLGEFPLDTVSELKKITDRIAQAGGTPLAVLENDRLLGAIHLKDIIKSGIRERFVELRRMGIRTVMITGDNPLTAAAIAAEAGVDDFLAEATPEDKLAYIHVRPPIRRTTKHSRILGPCRCHSSKRQLLTVRNNCLFLVQSSRLRDIESGRRWPCLTAAF